MNDLPLIDRLVAEISRRLPAGLGDVQDEIERNVQAVLREAIGRMDLVSREEFDIQQQVLGRTREKLEALERQVAELERPSAP
ncbi:MAG: accessory factor UbiK family protein [Alcanivorax sp.]|nr:accessory factor UbiK family protein [Alcanivorax sp.]